MKSYKCYHISLSVTVYHSVIISTIFSVVLAFREYFPTNMNDTLINNMLECVLIMYVTSRIDLIMFCYTSVSYIH